MVNGPVVDGTVVNCPVVDGPVVNDPVVDVPVIHEKSKFLAVGSWTRVRCAALRSLISWSHCGLAGHNPLR